MALPRDAAGLFGGQAVDVQNVGTRLGDGDLRAEQQFSQALGPGRADDDGAARRARDESSTVVSAMSRPRPMTTSRVAI